MKRAFCLHIHQLFASDAEGAGEMFRDHAPFDQTPRNEDGTVNFKEDFWKKQQSNC